jgi:hypothetical protein
MIKITCNEEELQELLNALEGHKIVDREGWFRLFKCNGTLFGSWNPDTGNGCINPTKLGVNT